MKEVPLALERRFPLAEEIALALKHRLQQEPSDLERQALHLSRYGLCSCLWTARSSSCPLARSSLCPLLVARCDADRRLTWGLCTGLAGATRRWRWEDYVSKRR